MIILCDQREGEPDILSPVAHENMAVKSLSGELLKTYGPPGGIWTLEAVIDAVLGGEVRELVDAHFGANVFIGPELVASTEA